MSFNTTAANTGHETGSFTLLLKKLGKDFFWLAFCHHKSFGPNANLFKIKINFVYWLAIRKSRAPADTAATWDHYTGQLN